MNTVNWPPLLTLHPNNIGTTAVPDHIPGDPLYGESTEPSVVADGKKSNWKSTATATTKLLLRGVRDSADVFGPLKSVAAGLCFILENCEVRPTSSTYDLQCLQVPQRTKANKQAIESLAPRVEAIAARLRERVPEGDLRERERRSKLER